MIMAAMAAASMSTISMRRAAGSGSGAIVGWLLRQNLCTGSASNAVSSKPQVRSVVCIRSSRLWNGQQQQQRHDATQQQQQPHAYNAKPLFATRRAFSSSSSSQHTTAIAGSKNSEASKQEQDEEDWQERLTRALEEYKSLSFEADGVTWIASVESVRDCHVHLGSWQEALTMEQELLDAFQQQSTLQQQQQDKQVKAASSSLSAIADCWHRMGSLHLQLQHFDRARTCYQRSLQLFYELHGGQQQQQQESSFSVFHRDMGKLLIGLGGICVHAGNPEQALPYLAQAEEHYRHHGTSLPGKGADGDRNHDNTPGNKNDVDDAISKSPHPELVVVLANQAVVHRMLGQHQLAIEKFQEILAIRRENDDDEDNNDDTASRDRDDLQFQIADCLVTIQQYSPALAHLETLLDNEVQRNRLSVDNHGGNSTGSPHEAAIRHLIGIIHSKQGRMEDALRELESAYVMKKSTLGELHPDVASSLNALGAVHASLGNDGEALSYFRESLMIARIHASSSNNGGGGEADEESDPQVMQTLRNISLVRGDKVPKWE